MTYYKAFNRDLTCKGFQYEEGETYEVKEKPVLCEKGFHFCKALVLTLEYYPVEKITDNKYAEVEVLGDTEFEKPTEHKGVTNKIKIVRVFTDDEVCALVDERSNSGDRNSGHWNSGDRNSGDWNSCNYETGAFNSVQSETIRVFNKDCDRKEWINAYKPNFLQFDIDKELRYKGSFQKSWDEADKKDRERVRELPNFDADVFFEISGIDLR